MSEIKVDKVKGRQAAASGAEVTFDSTGNISFGGNIASTGDVTADDVTLTQYYSFSDIQRVLYPVVENDW